MFKLRPSFLACLFALGTLVSAVAASAQVRIVAIGDSQIRGKGVSPEQAYPAKLERALRSKGHNVVVSNAGINGDTCPGVLARFDAEVPNGTQIVLFSVGINDFFGGASREAILRCIQQLEARVRARGMAVLNLKTGSNFQGAAYDRPVMHVEGEEMKKTNHYHLNEAGYDVVVRRTLPEVERLVAQAKRKGK